MPYRASDWAPVIIGVSLLLLVITFLSYPLARHGSLSVILFALGLGGERNVGAWWSGILFVLAAVSALDRAASSQAASTECRAWIALAVALALLSLDEIGSLHEWLSRRSEISLALLGLLGLGLVGYSLTNLYRAKVPLSKVLLGFALLATVPLHELVQHTQEWTNAWAYGARAFFEEGTELSAAVVLLAGTNAGLSRFDASPPEPFGSLAKFGVPLSWFSLGALALVLVAAYELNFTGPADWLGSALFLACALLAVRAAQRDAAAATKAVLYLLASVGANAVRADWDPEVLSHAVNLRGVYFGVFLLAAAWVTARGRPRGERGFWLALGALTSLAAFEFARPELIWSTWPPAVALLCFLSEVTAVRARATTPSAPIDSGGGPVASNRPPPFAGSL